MAKQKQVEKCIDTSALKLGEVHLSDIRSAQKLWSIFPHDTSAIDPVMKYAGGVDVPENLGEYFTLEVVTDHRWGLYVQPTETQPRPSSSRIALKTSIFEEMGKRRQKLVLNSAEHSVALAEYLAEPYTETIKRTSAIQQTRS